MEAVLTPALELLPSSYASLERTCPQGDDHDEWRTYCEASLADSGIVGIRPIYRHSLYAVADLVTPSTLQTILIKEVVDVVDGDLDTFGPLSGGLVLTMVSATIASGCCGDLSNLNDWENALHNTADGWQMLWIGHPWTHTRLIGDCVELAVPNGTKEKDQHEVACSIPRHELAEAIHLARAQIEAFGRRLETELGVLGLTMPSKDVLKVLLWGH